MRHLRQDHPDHSRRASAYLVRIERDEIRARLPVTVVFETVFTLERVYRQTRLDVRDAVLPLIELKGMVPTDRSLLRRTFDLYVGGTLSFADAYHAALAERFASGEIVSFDRDFDRIPGLRRVEP